MPCPACSASRHGRPASPCLLNLRVCAWPSLQGGSPTTRGSPTVKFGTSTRDQDAKVFISLEHEKGAFGTQSPGPVTAAPVSALGKQKARGTVAVD